MSVCGCESYGAGHNCHFIQAKQAGLDPKSWWPATIVERRAETVTVDYGDGTTARLWRHGGFDERAAVGTAVEVTERWSLVELPGPEGPRWLSVRVEHQGRPFKGPRHTGAPAVIRAAIVDIAAGEAIGVPLRREA